MEKKVDTDLARAWVQAIAETVAQNKEYLTGLDAAIGDGDHGANMERGFSAALEAVDGREAASAGEVLATAGKTLISRVGGASGPLYGTVFRTLGKRLAAPEDGTAALADALAAALEGVRTMGGAQVGDKTMVDAFSPAVEAFTAASDSGLGAAARSAAEAAEEGLRSTVPLQARKGRASYLGERSIGHADPGAASTALIFRALAEVAGRG
ncbi:MAG: dihydroxyacetone kinase subunit DhaL [Nocardiopsaceae bacterium]|nr:dihydroxyacetone kinase subunit DhaL [Nocardiopsaceae bacterium]